MTVLEIPRRSRPAGGRASQAERDPQRLVSGPRKRPRSFVVDDPAAAFGAIPALPRSQLSCASNASLTISFLYWTAGYAGAERVSTWPEKRYNPATFTRGRV